MLVGLGPQHGCKLQVCCGAVFAMLIELAMNWKKINVESILVYINKMHSILIKAPISVNCNYGSKIIRYILIHQMWLSVWK